MNKTEKNTFSYYYSAADSEVIKIRSKYLPKREESSSERKQKLTKLKHFLKIAKTSRQ